MPGKNRTGPMGNGPLTGRGTGRCAGTGNADIGNGRSPRRIGGNFQFDENSWNAWGRSRMRRCRQYLAGAFGMGATYPVSANNNEDKAQPLTSQTEVLQSRLDKIEKRLSELASQIAGNG